MAKHSYKFSDSKKMNDIDSFIYNPIRLEYTQEQLNYLGVPDNRSEIDKTIPQGLKIAGGIKNVLTASWLLEFNPVEESPALEDENPVSIFLEKPSYKPMQDLNRAKIITKAAVLKYFAAVEALGDQMFSLTQGQMLTAEGIAKNSKVMLDEFIQRDFYEFIGVFTNNSKIITDAFNRLTAPTPEPESPQEAVMDVEIRGVYRSSEAIRKNAINGDVLPRHDLALARGDAYLSGFTKEDFNLIMFAYAVRRDIKTAYLLDCLFSINCFIWLVAHRTINSMADFSGMKEHEKNILLNRLGLNWRGDNLILTIEERRFIDTAIKQAENLGIATRLFEATAGK